MACCSQLEHAWAGSGTNPQFPLEGTWGMTWGLEFTSAKSESVGLKAKRNQSGSQGVRVQVVTPTVQYSWTPNPTLDQVRMSPSDRCKLFEVGFLRGFLGFLAGERAHGGFPRRIPLDSYGGFSLSAGIPTEERARRSLDSSLE